MGNTANDGWKVLDSTVDDIRGMMYDITLFRSILNGTCANPAYKSVDKEQVADRLVWTQGLLLEEINKIRNGVFNEALAQIEEKFCSEAKK